MLSSTNFEHGVGPEVPGTMFHNSLLVNSLYKDRSSLVQMMVLNFRKILRVWDRFRADDVKEDYCCRGKP